MNKYVLLALLSLSFFTLPTFADSAAGEKIAANCVSCHGEKGQSQNSQFPNLAGQQSAYIKAQLEAFKSGSRNNPMMQSMAAKLSDTEMDDVAAFFSSQPKAKAGGDAALAKTGETKVAMCLGCHGEKGQGNGQFPALAGQQPDYLVKQLKAFKDGSRKSGHMKAIASTLSDDDMKAIAAYLGGL